MPRPPQPPPKRPNLYLPDGWDTTWQAAKARDCWGSGMEAGSTGVASPATPYPIVQTAGVTSQTQVALGSTKRADSPETITCTTPYACTALDILVSPSQGGAPAFSYTLDGAGSVNVTNVANAPMSKAISLTGLTNQVHTLVLSGATAAGRLEYQGMTTYNPGATGGLGFANFGYGGQSSQSHETDGVAQAWLGATTNAFTPGNFGFPTQPHLFILQGGINDALNLRGAQQWEFIYGRIIQMILRSRTNASIMILASADPTTYADSSSPFGNADWYYPIKEAMYRIARRFNCALVDVDAKWNLTPKGQGFLTGTDGHPNNAGQLDIANLILGVI
jgi:hypothetical protein